LELLVGWLVVCLGSFAGVGIAGALVGALLVGCWWVVGALLVGWSGDAGCLAGGLLVGC